MNALHRVIGFLVVAVFAVGWVWGLGARLFARSRTPGDPYWRWVATAQVTSGVQAILGLTMLVIGDRVSTGSSLSNQLHYVYGLLPLLIFAVAHVVARGGNLSAVGVRRRNGEEIPLRPWVPFAWASFICFGLTLRALMTGLGWGT
jgi:hypothetical protein